jgi:hypothetical protein
LGDISKEFGDGELRLYLEKRSAGEIAGISAAAFACGDIAWNRHRSAPQLTSQAVNLLSRKATSAGVDVYHEF